MLKIATSLILCLAAISPATALPAPPRLLSENGVDTDASPRLLSEHAVEISGRRHPTGVFSLRQQTCTSIACLDNKLAYMDKKLSQMQAWLMQKMNKLFDGLLQDPVAAPRTGYVSYKLTASDGAGTNDDSFTAADGFGWSVAIRDDRIVIGAHGNDDHGHASGSAYIFDTAGNQIAKLTADDAAASAYFGSSVAISDHHVVIGAHGKDGRGSAYVFDSDGSQVAKLTADDAAVDDYFGSSVAIDGDIVVVGACSNDDHGRASGSAYIFKVDGIQIAKLTADDAAADDLFGWSVAIRDDRIVIGAPGNDDHGHASGSAYIFDKEGNRIAKLTASDAAASALFGSSVAIDTSGWHDSGRIVVGAPGTDALGTDSGSAYIFDTMGNEITKFTAGDEAKASAHFGSRVAIDGDRIVVGAHGNDDHEQDSGSAYLFDSFGNKLATLNARDVRENGNFGSSVAISHENSGAITSTMRVVVGSSQFHSQGTAYLITPRESQTEKTTTTRDD